MCIDIVVDDVSWMMLIDCVDDCCVGLVNVVLCCLIDVLCCVVDCCVVVLFGCCADD